MTQKINSSVVDASIATTANLVAHTSDTVNPHAVTKAQVGLGNVDNTSDVDKPISTATQTALNGKLDKTGGAITGVSSITTNSASAALTVTQTGAGNAFVVEDSASTDATPFVIDASGNIVIGGVTAATSITGTAKIQLHGAGEPASALSLQNYQASSSYYPTIEFAKSKNSTDGSHTVVASGDVLGRFYFTGSDGAAFIRAAQIEAVVDGTPGTNDMPGRLLFSTTADGASSPTERMRIDSAGNVGIGATNASMSLRVAKNITGGAIAYGVVANGQVQTDVTVGSYGFTSLPSFANYAAVQHKHFDAAQGTISGTLTDQRAFSVDPSLTGATNNYGFYSAIPAAANRYNFYAAGTADNYFAGNLQANARLSVGAAGFSDTAIRIGGNIGTATTLQGSYLDVAIPATTTTAFYSHISVPTTVGTVFTLPILGHYRATAGSFGSTTVTNQYGHISESTLIGATNNYGFYSNIAAATGRWNFYAAGTADNYFAGSLGIGAAPTAGRNLTVNKTHTGALTSIGILSGGVSASDVTSIARGFVSNLGTAIASFTVTAMMHYQAFPGSFGAGSVVSNQYGFVVDASMTGGTSNFGFYSDIAAAANRYNFYANGTAANYFAGDLRLGKTVTAGGTTGAQTINKTVGTVNFAAAATSLVVTNSLVTTSSIIIATVGTNDTTMKTVAAVAAAGSFTLFANAAATAETRVNFIVIN